MQCHLSDTCGTFSGSVCGMEILGKDWMLPTGLQKVMVAARDHQMGHVDKSSWVKSIPRTWIPGGCLSSKAERELGSDFTDFDLFCCFHLNIERGHG